MDMDALAATLNRLNWRYGIGDIRRVVVTSYSSPNEPTRGYVTRSHGKGMGDTTRDFAVLSSGARGKRVRYLGRERLIRA